MNALRRQAKLSHQDMLDLCSIAYEIWKPITGYEGLYEVSNKGKVRNSEGKILKLCKDKDGYPRLSLHKNGITHTYVVHRLVATAFCYNPSPTNYNHVNHIDEVKDDNFYLNLEWCDNAYNHAYGTCGKRAGDKNSIPVIAKVLKTGEYEFYQSMSLAAEYLKGDNSHISDVVNGKRKTAYGRKWYRGTICLSSQGGELIDVTDDMTSTLRAESHHPPCILESAGFCTEHSAKSRSIGYEEEKSPTLRAGVVPAAIALENHPADSRIKISDDEICQTLTSRCGTGGGNVPLLMEAPKVYGICAKHSNAMLSDNPHSGFYEAETSRTLDTSNQSPCKNQGGMVVIEGNGSRPSHQGNGYKESEIMYTLNTVEVPAVAMADTAYAISRDNHFSVSEDVAGTVVARGSATVVHSNDDHYSTSKNSHHTVASHEKANTLVASDWKDPPVVNDTPNNEPAYIVRRLTPTECARLQGLPDWWCKNLDNPNPTDEEIQFWTEVWNEWNSINHKKPKTEKQIKKWLANPYSDSAEYKLYGNGIALPCAWFVLAGIAYYSDTDTQK